MNYMKIVNYDTNNGKNFRVSLFVSGCDKIPKCKFCHNKEAWKHDSGFKYTKDTEDYIINLLKQPLIKGFSILGGEPLDNLEGRELLKLVKRIKEELPHISIYCWTGWDYEQAIKRENVKEFLSYIDLLRDGEFIYELKDLNQYLQGSTNQRYINCKESLKQNKIIEYTF
jgi:anaerobic ribonucleoside-triphosphate reductase activating protein